MYVKSYTDFPENTSEYPSVRERLQTKLLPTDLSPKTSQIRYQNTSAPRINLNFSGNFTNSLNSKISLNLALKKQKNKIEKFSESYLSDGSLDTSVNKSHFRKELSGLQNFRMTNIQSKAI